MASKISSRSVYSWEVLLCLGGEEVYLGSPDTDHSTVISGLYWEASGHTTVSGCSDLLEQVYVIVISWPPRQTRKPTFPSRAGNAPQSPFWPPRNSFACCWLWRQRLVPMCTRPLISHLTALRAHPSTQILGSLSSLPLLRTNLIIWIVFIIFVNILLHSKLKQMHKNLLVHLEYQWWTSL